MHFPNGVLGASLRSVTIGTRFQIRLENRLQHGLGCGLHHAVPNRRNPERPLPASGLRDHYPPHRLWSIRPVAQLLSDARQPLLSPGRLDLLEALSIYSWSALIGARQCIGMGQNVLAINLV